MKMGYVMGLNDIKGDMTADVSGWGGSEGGRWCFRENEVWILYGYYGKDLGLLVFRELGG